MAAVILLVVFATGRTSLVQGFLNHWNVKSEATLTAEGYPDSLIQLYEKNEEARQFVLDYKKNGNNEQPIDISSDVVDGKIPLFLQWDERWGYRTYGDNFLAITGCGPTALSMVYVGLTGDTSMNPYAVAQMAQEEGFYVNGSGSAWSMMTELATKLGLSAQEMSLNEDIIIQELSQGHPIICIMGPGDFTTSGHFIVLTGVDSDGKIIVNDSNSKKNSNKTWKIEDLMSQIRDLWVYQ
ncbi:MAG: C39 family peptidase [Lachnospiraceae bacterium]|nr:C39 family peptidase [Lachnospiraceae bacterium]